jgi:hypothetical protein
MILTLKVLHQASTLVHALLSLLYVFFFPLYFLFFFFIVHWYYLLCSISSLFMF